MRTLMRVPEVPKVSRLWSASQIALRVFLGAQTPASPPGLYMASEKLPRFARLPSGLRLSA